MQRGRSYIRQSAAILLYLSELSGKFGGRSDAEKRAILEWLFFDADMVASLRISRTLTTYSTAASRKFALIIVNAAAKRSRCWTTSCGNVPLSSDGSRPWPI